MFMYAGVGVEVSVGVISSILSPLRETSLLLTWQTRRHTHKMLLLCHNFIGD